MQSMLRSPFLRALGFAGLVSFTLFWMLHLLIGGHGRGIDKGDTLPTIDFVRLKRDSELETRTRQKPPKPPPPKEPPPPKMQVDSAVKPQEAPLPFNIPNLNLGMNLGSGPFIGNLAAAGAAGGYSDLIPLVALQPQYPRNAARDGIEGWVDVEITVGTDGNVKSARAVNAKPRGVFEAAAIGAALKSRFRPKMVDGKPEEQKGIRRYNFTLSKN